MEESSKVMTAFLLGKRYGILILIDSQMVNDVRFIALVFLLSNNFKPNTDADPTICDFSPRLIEGHLFFLQISKHCPFKCIKAVPVSLPYAWHSNGVGAQVIV